MEGMFEKVSRMKLRFDYKGWCSVEDLWDLAVGELDRMYKSLNARMKEQEEESLLDTKSQEDAILELEIAIVKHIVAVKLAEQEARENRTLNAERKRKLLAIVAEKQDEDLKGKSIKDLNKMIDALE